MKQATPNHDVSAYLDGLKHPLRVEIQTLREQILMSSPLIVENYKWNGPNYCVDGYDRITMQIHAPGRIELVFRIGVAALVKQLEKIVERADLILEWQGGDQVVLTYHSMQQIEAREDALHQFIRDWVDAFKQT